MIPVTVKPGEKLPFAAGSRLERERRTVAAMIAIFCRDLHARGASPCGECSELDTYARLRLEKCPFGELKPTCANCPIHCYLPERREQMRRVMSHSGPRIFWRHPTLAARHWIDGLRRAPQNPRPRIAAASKGDSRQ